jgi:hypothetical protein
MTDPNQLERLVDDVLRKQPLRRAPASLEARVLARIGEHEALPWWREGFAHWPAAARLAALIALIVIAKLTLDAVVWMFSAPTPVNHAVASSEHWARSTASTAETMLGLCRSFFELIPSHWITVALAFAAGMYIMLFALGATAYRTLYLNK